jgi:hypothetical protein
MADTKKPVEPTPGADTADNHDHVLPFEGRKEVTNQFTLEDQQDLRELLFKLHQSEHPDDPIEKSHDSVETILRLFHEPKIMLEEVHFVLAIEEILLAMRGTALEKLDKIVQGFLDDTHVTPNRISVPQACGADMFHWVQPRKIDEDTYLLLNVFRLVQHTRGPYSSIFQGNITTERARDFLPYVRSKRKLLGGENVIYSECAIIEIPDPEECLTHECTCNGVHLLWSAVESFAPQMFDIPSSCSYGCYMEGQSPSCSAQSANQLSVVTHD